MQKRSMPYGVNMSTELDFRASVVSYKANSVKRCSRHRSILWLNALVFTGICIMVCVQEMLLTLVKEKPFSSLEQM